MGRAWWALVLVFLSACSFVFVKEPNEAMLKREAPLTCTSSRTLPIVDFAIGAVLGSAIFAATYGAIEEFNDECEPGGCYTPWKPALLASFLVVSPWWISSAVGLSDTQACRKAADRARVSAPSPGP